MYYFTFLDNIRTLQIGYFGLTLSDLHSLIEEMADGEGWQQTRKRLAPVTTSSRPDAHRHQEVAHPALPRTGRPSPPCPQSEEDSISFLPSWLGHLSQVIRLTIGSNYLATFFKARALGRNPCLFL